MTPQLREELKAAIRAAHRRDLTARQAQALNYAEELECGEVSRSDDAVRAVIAEMSNT